MLRLAPRTEGFRWGYVRGMIQFYLRGRPLKVWLCSSEYMDNTHWTFSFFYKSFITFLMLKFGGRGSHMGGGEHEITVIWEQSGYMMWNFLRINILLKKSPCQVWNTSLWVIGWVNPRAPPSPQKKTIQAIAICGSLNMNGLHMLVYVNASHQGQHHLRRVKTVLFNLWVTTPRG